MGVNEKNQGYRNSQKKEDGQPDKGQDHPDLGIAGAEKQGHVGTVIQQVVPLQDEHPGSDEKGQKGQEAEMNFGAPRQVEVLIEKDTALPPVQEGESQEH